MPVEAGDATAQRVATERSLDDGVATDEAGEHDGRRLRRERNRDAVVDAMLALHRAGNLDPSSAEIAEQAGLSPRSVFRYFDDLEDLARAAISRQQQRALPLVQLTVDRQAPLAERVATVVEQRLALFDEIGATAAVARLRAPFQPVIAEELQQGRAFLRTQIRRVFAPELGVLPAARAGALLAAADVLLSYESYALLRHDQGLSRPKAAAAMVEGLTALFAHGTGEGA